MTDNTARPLRQGRPPRLLRDAFLLPRGLLGQIGGLVARLLAERCPGCRIDLVDPSVVMRAQSGRRCRAAIGEGRVTIHAGTAEVLPFADASFDLVAAVNNVALWSDLETGLREARRVLRGGGRIVISWHAATAPGKMQQRLALSEVEAETLTNAMGEVFGVVQRRSLTYSDVWEATVALT